MVCTFTMQQMFKNDDDTAHTDCGCKSTFLHLTAKRGARMLLRASPGLWRYLATAPILYSRTKCLAAFDSGAVSISVEASQSAKTFIAQSS